MQCPSIHVEKLFLTTTTNDPLIQYHLNDWLIKHIDTPLCCNIKLKRFSVCCGSNCSSVDPNLHNQIDRMPLFEIVTVSPPFDPGGNHIILKLDSETQLRLIPPDQHLVFVLDLNPALLMPTASGKSFVSSCINSFMEVLSKTIFSIDNLPNVFEHYLTASIRIFISVLVVGPGCACHYVVSNKRLMQDNVSSLLSQISKSIRNLEHLYKNHPVNSAILTQPVSVVDLLMHGMLCTSINRQSTSSFALIIVTNGCFLATSISALERSLAYLRKEQIRCSFILISEHLLPQKTPMLDGTAYRFIADLSTFIPQRDLCQHICFSTRGSFLTLKDKHIQHPYPSFDDPSIQSLYSIPVNVTTKSLDSEHLLWDTYESLQLSDKIIKAPISMVFATCLHEGFRLRSYKLCTMSQELFDETKFKFEPSRADDYVSDSQAQSSTDHCTPSLLINVLQLIMTRPIKYGITLHLKLIGVCHNRCSHCLPIPSVSCEGTSLSDCKSDIDIDLSAADICRFTLAMNSSFHIVSEIAHFQTKADMPNNSSLLKFALDHSIIQKVTECCVNNPFVLSPIHNPPTLLSEYLNNASPVFTTLQDSNGKALAVLNGPVANLLEQAHPSSPLLDFIRYWRLFLKTNLLNSQEWLSVHSIYGILEHDSPLSTNLSISAEGSTNTGVSTCRLALVRLQSFLASWSSFVLLENDTYIKFLQSDSTETSSMPCSYSDAASKSKNNILCKLVRPFDHSWLPKKTESSCFQASEGFYIIKLDVQSPVFQLRLGFPAGTLNEIQKRTVREIISQVRALCFPPRGRQAIPKSRHKSGAHSVYTNVTRVPPLQRSWEDTLCCTIFRTPLDRLILNTGILMKDSPFIVKNKAQRFDQNYSFSPHRVIIRDPIISQLPCCSVAGSSPFRTSCCLLAQHFYHECRLWLIQPSTLSSDCLKVLFSSLINIRLQQGFQLARTGPQSGFVNLATEVTILYDGCEWPCLVQYLIYPFYNRTHASDKNNSHETKVSRQDITSGQLNSGDDTAQTSIDTSSGTSQTLTLSSVQLVTEVWVQKAPGYITGCSYETKDWLQLQYSDIPSRIFNLDCRCILAYVTLERILNAVFLNLDGSVNISFGPLLVPTPVYFQTRCGVGFSATISPANNGLSILLSLSPCFIALYPLLKVGFASIDKYNDFLLTYLCQKLAKNNHVAEIRLTSHDSKLLFLHLLERNGASKDDFNCTSYPKWYCFASSSKPSSQPSFPKSADKLGEEISLVNLFFIPATSKDARHSAVLNIVDRISGNIHRSAESRFPIFMFSCSRMYLSFLLDDAWTYKRPGDSHFDFTMYPETPVIQCDPFESFRAATLEPPEIFLNAGCQNLRLTQELSNIWSYLIHWLNYFTEASINAFVAAVYLSVRSHSSVSKTDLMYVLEKATTRTPMTPLILEATSFLICGCAHLFDSVKQKLEATGQDDKSSLRLLNILCGKQNGILLEQYQPALVSLNLQGFKLSLCAISDTMRDRFHAVMQKYLFQLPGLPGVFVLQNLRSTTQFAHSSKNCDPIIPHNPAAFDSVDGSDAKYIYSNICNTSFMCGIDEDGSNHSTSSMPTRSHSSRLLTPNVWSWAGGEMEHQKTSHLQFFESLSESLSEWLSKVDLENTGARDTEENVPFFVKLYGTLTYKGRSACLPMFDGLPLFCVNTFSNTLLQLIYGVDGNTCVDNDGSSIKVDLTSLTFSLEVQPIIWPSEISGSKVDVQNDPLKCYIGDQFGAAVISRTLDSEGAIIAITTWRNQPHFSFLSRFHRDFVSRYALRLSWQICDEVTSYLRQIGSCTESVLETVLRHIEDSQKLLSTCLFQECPVQLVNEASCISHKKGALPPIRVGPVLPTDSGHKVTSLQLSDMIGYARVSLGFVYHREDNMTQFLKQFESLLFGCPVFSLQLLGGYYFIGSQRSVSKGEAEATHSAESPRVHWCCCCHPKTQSLTESPPACSPPGSRSSILRRCSSNLVSSADKRTFYSFASAQVPTNPRSNERQPLHRRSLSLDNNGAVTDIIRSNVRNVQNPLQPRTSASGFSNEAGKTIALQRDGATLMHCILPEYWLILRVCDTSVNLFFHQTATRQPSPCFSSTSEVDTLSAELGNQSVTIDEMIRLPPASPHLRCSHNEHFMYSIKNVHTIIRLINQRLLLNKLRDDRYCDPLLVAPNTTQQHAAFSHRRLRTFKRQAGKHNGNRLVTGKPGYHNQLHTENQVLLVERCTSLHSDFAEWNRNHLAYSIISQNIPVVPILNLPPGTFACPVRHTTYLHLHPRVIIAASFHKNRGVVHALRNLLEQLAVANQPDMFVIIDSSPTHAALDGKCRIAASNKRCPVTPTALLPQSGERSVFYMILKEVTPISSSINDHDHLHEKSINKKAAGLHFCSRKHRQNDASCSILSDCTIESYTTVDDGQPSTEGLQQKSPSDRLHKKENQALQVTLHGIDTPSKSLCNSMRHLLQRHLDSLVSKHISDGLFRNAINRLSRDDLVFLTSRRYNTPQCHHLYVLPQCLSFGIISGNTTSDASNALRKIYSFCYYFRQNLSLFLTAVKAEFDPLTLEPTPNPIELFLHNQPMGEGVRQFGVATLMFRVSACLVALECVESDGAHLIDDENTGDRLDIARLRRIINDFREISPDQLLSTDHSSPSARVTVLSVHMWRREQADLELLKHRVSTAIRHSLYDLVTEFHVLATPLTFARATAQDVSPEASECGPLCDPIGSLTADHLLSPNLLDNLCQWMQLGRSIDSPLLTEIAGGSKDRNLASSINVEQFLFHVLRPYYSTSVTTTTGPSGGGGIGSGFSDSQPLHNSYQAGSFVTGVGGLFESSAECRQPFSIYSRIHHLQSCYHLTRVHRLQSGFPLTRPGVARTFLVVSRRSKVVAGGKSGLDYRKYSLPEIKPEPVRESSMVGPSLLGTNNEGDFMLRMQPLHLFANCKSSRRTNISSLDRVEPGEQTDKETPCSELSDAVTPGVDYLSSVATAQVHSSTPGGIDLTLSRLADQQTIATTTSPTSQLSGGLLQLPRQACLLITVRNCRLTAHAYNWSKEEAERLGLRFASLLEWHNRRHQLLTCLTNQKLGLFHHVEKDASSAWCALRITDLVARPCPPEYAGQKPSPVQSGTVDSALGYVASTGWNRVAGARLHLLQSTGSSPRDRQATPNRELPRTATERASTSVGLRSTVSSEEKRAIDHFLHLYQGCADVPALHDRQQQQSSRGCTDDPVLLHGRQALDTLEVDRRQAQRLELVTLPFLAWQEVELGQKPADSEKAGTADYQTFSVLSASNKSRVEPRGSGVCGTAKAEAVFDSESSQNRLRCLSAARVASRHLHTVCTPFLFCPRLRSETANLANRETVLLRRTAEACYFPSAGGGGGVCCRRPQGSPGPVNPPGLHSGTPVAGSDPVSSPATAHRSAALSAWLAWSDSVILQAGLNQPVADLHPPSPSSETPGGLIRSAAEAFLAQYSTYVQHDVGFHAIPLRRPTVARTRKTSNSSSSSSTSLAHNYQQQPRQHHQQQQQQQQQAHQQTPGCSSLTTVPTGDTRVAEARPRQYALFHRIIYMAGVHLMEVFVRHSRIYVRLSTIELSRFNNPASRTITTGPLSAEVIGQAAVSAITSALSIVQATTSSRTRGKLVSVASLPHSINSWTESGRLCDYTHVHSFSYDFYLRAVEQYLTARLVSSPPHSKQVPVRKQTRPVRKTSKGAPSGVGYTGPAVSFTTAETPAEALVIGDPDFPFTDFLADMIVLTRQPPVFARGCLRRLQVSCPIGQFTRPDQVFCHLATDGLQDAQIIHLKRNQPSGEFNDNPRDPQTVAVVEQHLATESVTPREFSWPPRQSSQPSLDATTSNLLKDIQELQEGGGSVESTASSVSTETTTSSTSNMVPPLAPFPRLDYSVTGIFTLADRVASEPPGDKDEDRLPITVYVLVTDPSRFFPVSQLTSLRSDPSQRSHFGLLKIDQPVEWPAVAASLNMDTDAPVTLSTENHHRTPLICALTSSASEAHSALRLSFSTFCRNRHISLSLDSEQTTGRAPAIGTIRRTGSSSNAGEYCGTDGACATAMDSLAFESTTTASATTTSSSSSSSKRSSQTHPAVVNDLRWHISYLATWPAHQAPLLAVLATAEVNLKERITRLVLRSGVDFHKNLLWHRLFDTQQQQQQWTEMESLGAVAGQNSEGAAVSALPQRHRRRHQSNACCDLTADNVEELIQSAPFILDLLMVDRDLPLLLRNGAEHFYEAVSLLTDPGDDQGSPQEAGRSSTSPFAIVFPGLTHVASTKQRHCIVLASLSCYDGFVLLSWETDNTAGPPIYAVGSRRSIASVNTDQPTNLQFCAVFRKLRDNQKPANNASASELHSLVSHNFFSQSSLPGVVAAFVNKLNYCVWRRLHTWW